MMGGDSVSDQLEISLKSKTNRPYLTSRRRIDLPVPVPAHLHDCSGWADWRTDQATLLGYGKLPLLADNVNTG